MVSGRNHQKEYDHDPSLATSKFHHVRKFVRRRSDARIPRAHPMMSCTAQWCVDRICGVCMGAAHDAPAACTSLELRGWTHVARRSVQQLRKRFENLVLLRSLSTACMLHHPVDGCQHGGGMTCLLPPHTRKKKRQASNVKGAVRRNTCQQTHIVDASSTG